MATQPQCPCPPTPAPFTLTPPRPLAANLNFLSGFPSHQSCVSPAQLFPGGREHAARDTGVQGSILHCRAALQGRHPRQACQRLTWAPGSPCSAVPCHLSCLSFPNHTRALGLAVFMSVLCPQPGQEGRALSRAGGCAGAASTPAPGLPHSDTCSVSNADVMVWVQTSPQGQYPALHLQPSNTMVLGGPPGRSSVGDAASVRRSLACRCGWVFNPCNRSILYKRLNGVYKTQGPLPCRLTAPPEGAAPVALTWREGTGRHPACTRTLYLNLSTWSHSTGS